MPLAVAVVHQGQGQVRGHLGGSDPRQELARDGPGLRDDGSYTARMGYGVLRVTLPKRVIEATRTVTLADSTVRTEQWRLITNLLGPVRFPAAAADTVTAGQGISPRTPIDWSARSATLPWATSCPPTDGNE
ncbi:hypothetical protein SAZ11_03210 [Streptomyces sp. FXJ1.4098]|uniref:hypothetical protein n=1 Tax=Streptomyces sp. NPDC020845 TaxID=3365096 RepID=UPI002990D5DB|nr:hypothetical protein [Streptomyces sp. FXJ1.4098]